MGFGDTQPESVILTFTLTQIHDEYLLNMYRKMAVDPLFSQNVMSKELIMLKVMMFVCGGFTAQATQWFLSSAVSLPNHTFLGQA